MTAPLQEKLVEPEPLQVDNQHIPAVFDAAAIVRILVRRNDTRPRLDQRRLDVARRLLHRHEISPLVALQHLLGDDAVKRHATVKGIPIRHDDVLIVDVGLDDQALANSALALQLLADFLHGDYALMPQHDRILLQVSAAQAWMIAAQIDDFNVGKTDAAGIVPDKKLTRLDFGQGDSDLLEIVETWTVKFPAVRLGWQRRPGRAVLFEYGYHRRTSPE